MGDREGRPYSDEPLGSSEQSFRLIVETIPGLIAVMTPTGEVSMSTVKCSTTSAGRLTS